MTLIVSPRAGSSPTALATICWTSAEVGAFGALLSTATATVRRLMPPPASSACSTVRVTPKVELESFLE